jgi:ADP-ribose pyrophosphatase
MEPVILNKQNVAETRFLNLVTTTYQDKNGNMATWISAERPNGQNAVVIVALKQDDMNNALLVGIKEFRVPINGYEYGMAAGLIDPGQSVEETAIRELKEETGLDVVRFIRPVTPMVFNSPGLTSEAVSYAFVEASGTLSDTGLHASEDISAFAYSRAAVAQLLADAREPDSKILIGAKSWLIFERFVKYGDI